MCDYVEESSYKSLNSDLVKCIQTLKQNINDYKQEIIHLNNVGLVDREHYANYKTLLQAHIENVTVKYTKELCQKIVTAIASFDLNNYDSTTIEGEVLNSNVWLSLHSSSLSILLKVILFSETNI